MYDNVKLFHELMGKTPHEKVGEKFWEDVRQQAERVLEEAQEMFVAAYDRNLKEVLDGYVDVSYTNTRIEQLLEGVGVATYFAEELVLENNLTKFTQDEEIARASVHHYQEKSPGEMYFYKRVELNGKVYYPVIRSSDGKLCKPLGFEPVNLDICLEGVRYE